MKQAQSENQADKMAEYISDRWLRQRQYCGSIAELRANPDFWNADRTVSVLIKRGWARYDAEDGDKLVILGKFGFYNDRMAISQPRNRRRKKNQA